MLKRWKMLVLIFAAVLVFACMGTAIADAIMPRYEHVNIMRCSLNFENGRAVAWGMVSADRSLPTSVVVKLKQYYEGEWRTIGSWSGSTSIGVAEAGGSEEIDQGFDYIVYVEGTVKDTNGNILETVSGHTDVRSY